MKLHKLGCVAVAVLLLLGIPASILGLNAYFQDGGGRADEVLEAVDQIRDAEISYEVSWDTYLPVTTPSPRPVARLDGNPVWFDWNEGFSNLGWWPTDSNLYGTYWVEVDPSGDDFTVHGAIKVNGEVQHYTATKDLPVSRAAPLP